MAPEEEAQVEFKPLVTLEEVKTSTGEEDEVHLSDPPFKIRAKLFRYESDTWNKEEKLWKDESGAPKLGQPRSMSSASSLKLTIW